MLMSRKLKLYFLTAVAGLVFSLLGFSYNAWRLEVSEDNNTIRTSAFEVLKALAELEQVVYSAHYDHNEVEGSPRKGWVRVGLVVDLSPLIGAGVARDAQHLRDSWQDNWPQLGHDQAAVQRLVADIDQVRGAITSTLRQLH